jgi:hypothetical protein
MVTYEHLMLCDHCLLERKIGPQSMRWVPSARNHQCSRKDCDRIFDEFQGYMSLLKPDENRNFQKCTCSAARAMYIDEVTRTTCRYRCAVTECQIQGPIMPHPQR